MLEQLAREWNDFLAARRHAIMALYVPLPCNVVHSVDAAEFFLRTPLAASAPAVIIGLSAEERHAFCQRCHDQGWVHWTQPLGPGDAADAALFVSQPGVDLMVGCLTVLARRTVAAVLAAELAPLVALGVLPPLPGAGAT